VSVARALVVVARRLPFEEEKRKVVVVVAVKKKEEGKDHGRVPHTSGPTPVSESGIHAVAQRCATRVCFRFDDVWVHVEVRKGKERFRIRVKKTQRPLLS
jgi:prophage antirepressor-like protein